MHLCNATSPQPFIKFERTFPATFADLCEKPYGKLYYNTCNPKSHDCNHGLILNLNTDLNQALEDLIMFYRLRSLTPRIYPSYQEGEKQLLLPLLLQRKFHVEYIDSRIYIRQNFSRIMPDKRLRIKRIRTMDSKISHIIKTEDGGNWNVVIIERQLQFDNFHLLVGYDKDEPVCLATLTYLHPLARLDDVITELGNRAQGYGRALIKGILDYHDAIAPPYNIFLWASNPTAVKIYREAGFVEPEFNLEPWEAWLAP